jgi:hypothetical protein
MLAVGPMSRCRVLLVGWLSFLVLGVGASHAAVSQTIYAYFDVDGNLQFRYADSSNVGSTIPPGTYTINLNNNGADDLGIDHIFHIFGPGLDYKAASVDTQATFSATFQAGATYTIQDDLDPKDIHQSLLATTAPPPATTPTKTTPTTGSTKPTSSDIVGSEVVPFRGSLDAIVYAGGKLSLTRFGKVVSSLKTGRYTFSVDDESTSAGFMVQALHKKAVTVTSGRFKGDQDVTLTLKPGRWFFFSSSAKKSQFFVIS